MAMIWNSSYGTPMPTFAPEPGREYTPTSTSRTFTPSSNTASSEVDQWKHYLKTIEDALRESSGFERFKLQAQREDAEKGLRNAMEIARLQAETSRYGVDIGRQTALDQLRENQRQYDLNHGVELQRLGLTRAQGVVDLMRSSDRYADAGNFLALSSRVLANQAGAGTFGAAVQPRGNTESDFAVLAAGGNPWAGRGNAAQAATAGGGAGTDARVKALKAVIDAAPPSAGTGHDPNDFAVLNAARAIYGMNLNPQQQASINSDPKFAGILGSEIRTMGDDPESWMRRQRASLPGQGRVQAA